jgi:hypothetical protein
MGHTTPIIRNFSIPSYSKIIVETSDDFRYESDLTTLTSVYCFPKSEEEWRKCSVDAYGLAIIWTSRFEVHVDQIIGLAVKSTKLTKVG